LALNVHFNVVVKILVVQLRSRRGIAIANRPSIDQVSEVHVHATQPNPYAALDSLRSAQKTAARREAELVRKELVESASELAGEPDLIDACVLEVEARKESQRQPRRRNQQKDRNGTKQEEPADGEEGGNHLSDWA
jgi:hypothetical protein